MLSWCAFELAQFVYLHRNECMITVIPASWTTIRNLLRIWILSIKVIIIMDSELSPHIRADLKFSCLIPICLIWSLWVVCYLPSCSGTKIRCSSDPLSSFLKDRFTHSLTNSPNWLQPCHQCRLLPRLSKGTSASSLWILKCHVWAHTGLL